VKGEGQGLHPAVEFVTDVVGETVRQPQPKIALAEAGKAPQQGDDQDDAAGDEQGRRRSCSQALVDGAFNNLRHEEVE
jgi:hypothetical protein